MEKTCNKCGEIKPIDRFYKASGAKDGHRGECIECAEVVRRARYDANKDKAIEAARRWQERNCNHGLGKFFDDVDLLERAVAYLRGR